MSPPKLGPAKIVAFFLVALVHHFLWHPASSAPTPFLLFHGLHNQCSKARTIRFLNRLSEWSNTKGYCIEIGNGTWSSWFVPLGKQVEEACNKVKAMKELSNGYNIVVLSQGNLIGRGVVEFCEGAPKAKNFISVAAPHAGIASVPLYQGAGRALVDNILKAGIYSDYVQKRLAPSGYTKVPTDIKGYLKSCSFLPKLNNEGPDQRNPNYKKRFSALKNLVLIMNENETVIKPKESSWFGYYADGDTKILLKPQETKLYTEDWIGLKKLNNAGRVKFIRVAGLHTDISDADIKKYVIPYLQDKRHWRPENGGTESEDGGAVVVNHHRKPERASSIKQPRKISE